MEVERAHRDASGDELVALAGNLVHVGVPADADDRAIETLRALRPGGVVLFARNVPSVAAGRELVRRLRDALEDDPARPLSVCVDQEGGRVARVPRDVPMPSMMALGATGDARLAYEVGGSLASAVRAVDGNVDFAPVLDLALVARSTVVGTRSLGDDPARVATLGAALVRGIEDGGVAAVPKHFPGHGATADDSHVAIPVVDVDRATLERRELVPFRAAFAAGARGTMAAHVRVSALDPTHVATRSARVLTALLRDELGFDGACFTDCLEMDGATGGDQDGTVRGGVAALAAGADGLVVSHSLARALALRDAIVAAVADGRVSVARLREASARIDAFRRGHVARRAFDASAEDDVARRVARAAIVRVRGEPRIDRERAVTIVSFEGAASDGIAASRGERPSLNLALRRRRVRSELMRVALAPDAAMCEMLVDVVRGERDRALVLLARRAHHAPEQRAAIDALLAIAPDAIAVSMLEPFDVPALARARHVLCTFGDEEANVDALADVLVGAIVPSGSLPVTLSGSS